jgi:hypothetical protein
VVIKGNDAKRASFINALAGQEAWRADQVF